MSSQIYCHKFKKEMDQLSSPPLPGALGKRIYENISAQAWNDWLGHQTMIINEYRLNLMDIKSKQFICEEMEKFLFGGGADKPEGYVADKG
jgi:Fe-S cluster biosynthesis and repair protein YggX